MAAMRAPNHEIELKFDLAAGDIAVVMAALPPGKDACQTLLSIYFDTVEQTLSAKGFGLRVRRSGERFIQTLKSSPAADGGRDEWEWPVVGLAPDADLLAETPAALPSDAALTARFTVEVDRLQRLVAADGGAIEVALDRGKVRADGREQDFIELELELKAGDPAALFALAGRLLDAAPLVLSFVTKAGRGEALLEGNPLRREGYRSPNLAVDATAGEALRTIGQACLTQMAANAASLRRAAGPEGVHQLRVAVRRLRSTLATFRDIARDADVARVKAELKWLADELAPARNLDAFIQQVWRPQARAQHELDGMAAFGAALLSAQTGAYRRVAAAVDSPRFRRLMLDTAAWLQAGSWAGPDAPAADRRDRPARAFARKALSRRRRRVLKRGESLAEMDPAARHRLRIQAKKMRYAAEDLAPLFPEHPGRRTRFIDSLKALQDRLGLLNDLAVSTALAEAVAVGAGLPEAAWAAGRLTGERRANQSRMLKATKRAHAAFAKTKAYW